MKNEAMLGKGFFGYIFALWFCASALGIYYFYEQKDYWKILVILGQFFLIFGIVEYISVLISRQSSSVVGLISVSIGVIGVALFFMHFMGMKDMRKTVIYILPGMAIVLGLCMAVGAFVEKKVIQRRCSYRVTAVCVELLRRRGGGNTRCPQYEFYLNGERYLLNHEKYREKNLPRQGERREIFINYDHPEEFLEVKEDAENVRLTMAGIILVAFGGVFLYEITHNDISGWPVLKSIESIESKIRSVLS